MGAAVGERAAAPLVSSLYPTQTPHLLFIAPPACSAEQQASAPSSPSSRSARGRVPARPSSQRPPQGARRAAASRRRPQRTALSASPVPSKVEPPPVCPLSPLFLSSANAHAGLISSTDDLHRRVLARRPRRARLGRRAGHRARDGARARRSGRARRVLPRPARRPGGGVGEGRRVREEARGEDGRGCEA